MSAADGIGEVPRCHGCQWEGENHDKILRLQEDPAVLARIISDIVCGDDDMEGVDGGVRSVNIPEFIRQHNWPMPQEAAFLASDIEAIYGRFRDDFKAPVTTLHDLRIAVVGAGRMLLSVAEETQ